MVLQMVPYLRVNNYSCNFQHLSKETYTEYTLGADTAFSTPLSIATGTLDTPNIHPLRYAIFKDIAEQLIYMMT